MSTRLKNKNNNKTQGICLEARGRRKELIIQHKGSIVFFSSDPQDPLSPKSLCTHIIYIYTRTYVSSPPPRDLYNAKKSTLRSSRYTYTHTHTHRRNYIYVYKCVSVCAPYKKIIFANRTRLRLFTYR